MKNSGQKQSYSNNNTKSKTSIYSVEKDNSFKNINNKLVFGLHSAGKEEYNLLTCNNTAKNDNTNNSIYTVDYVSGNSNCNKNSFKSFFL